MIQLLILTLFEGSSGWSRQARYLAKNKEIQYPPSPTGVTTAHIDETAFIQWVCYEASVSLGFQF